MPWRDKMVSQVEQVKAPLARRAVRDRREVISAQVVDQPADPPIATNC